MTARTGSNKNKNKTKNKRATDPEPRAVAVIGAGSVGLTTAATGASVVVVPTKWDDVRWLDFSRVRSVMAIPFFIDARNLLDTFVVRHFGFASAGIGRP